MRSTIEELVKSAIGVIASIEIWNGIENIKGFVELLVLRLHVRVLRELFAFVVLAFAHAIGFRFAHIHVDLLMAVQFVAGGLGKCLDGFLCGDRSSSPSTRRIS